VGSKSESLNIERFCVRARIELLESTQRLRMLNQRPLLLYQFLQFTDADSLYHRRPLITNSDFRHEAEAK
jgi:hypothetical protein